MVFHSSQILPFAWGGWENKSIRRYETLLRWLVRWFVETLSVISLGGRGVRESQRCRVVVDLGPEGRQEAQMVGLTSWYISQYYEVNEKFITAI